MKLNFYFLNKNQHFQDENDYKTKIEKLIHCVNKKEMINFLRYFKNPTDINMNFSLFCFKDDIQPFWEDDKNRNGS